MTFDQPLSVMLDPVYIAEDTLNIKRHNATHPEELSPNGWVDKWVFQVLLGGKVRSSKQEDEALRNFERSQQG